MVVTRCNHVVIDPNELVYVHVNFAPCDSEMGAISEGKSLKYFKYM